MYTGSFDEKVCRFRSLESPSGRGLQLAFCTCGAAEGSILLGRWWDQAGKDHDRVDGTRLFMMCLR
jgi:hypothetical protein